MIADTSTRPAHRYWSPRTRPRSRPRLLRRRPTPGLDFQTTRITEERSLTLRERLAKAIDPGILYVVSLNLAVAVLAYLLAHPSVGTQLMSLLSGDGVTR